MSETREGGCGCGQVRYRLEGEPIFVNNCHCRQCQQQTGGTSVVNMFYESERVTVTSGTLTEHVLKAGSGHPHTICRCSECGVALWSFYPRIGRFGAGIRVGTLDDPGSITPTAAIFVAEKMPWVTLPEGVPHFDGQYNMRELLSPEQLGRLGAVLARNQASEGN